MKLTTRVLILIFVLGIFWEIFIFINYPKQAFIQGLVESWFVSNGLFFYRDFTGTYFPFLRLIMVPYHLIFGFNQTTTIILAPVFSILTLTLIFYASLKWLKGVYSLIPPIFFLVWDSYISLNHFVTTTFLSFTTFISFLFLLSWYKKPTKFNSFLLGVFLSISLLTLQTMLVFMLIVFLFISIKIFLNKRDLRFLLPLTLGLLTVILPIFLLLFYKGVISDFYYWTIEYHLTSYPYTKFGKGLDNILIFLSIESPILILSIVLIRKMIFKDFKNLLELGSALTILASYAIIFWFSIFHPLRFQTILALNAFSLGLGIQHLFASVKNKKKFIFTIVLIIIIFQAFMIIKYIIPFYKSNILNPSKKEILSEIYPEDPMYDAVRWIKYNTEANSRIFVLGDLLFYFESQRLVANARGASNIPTVFDPLDKFFAELMVNTPNYWIIDERNFTRFEDFGYSHFVPPFKKLLECEKEVAKFDYWTVRKHQSGNKLCI